ncbi:hypothetical protein [Tenacibaculum sp. IB213877]|uniref:hypothetical protein n=1 Tax=Tenacibaculum sp. IB213877 TaxID=3097351 RepID=UPI002A5AE579|nr:hypothetical protein [Tenacibaculum sp. IB213877]MDY0780703.1 hypothetical protein [Tenacibaculum sp. IB213877]
MYLINAHAVPGKESEYFNEVKGAFVSVYINYADVEGALQLAKFYIEDEGWKVESIDDDYYVIDGEEELDEDLREFYQEAKEYGYSIIFNCYEEGDEEE